MATETKQTAPKTGADVVVRSLEQQGVKWVFGVPGAKIDKVFNTLVDSSIETVVCRHEQNAAFIAGGIGRMTGNAGIAIATSGPGISNLTAGLATANTEGDPVVALGGAVPLADRLKKIHRSMDSVSLMHAVTKYSVEVDSPESVGEVMANAFRSAESDRPGAAFVSLPMDIMISPAKCDVITPCAWTIRQAPAERAGGPGANHRKAGEVDVTASAVVAAVQAYGKINSAGQWLDRSEQVSLNDLFDRMSTQELEEYAQHGTLPHWFEAASGAMSRE